MSIEKKTVTRLDSDYMEQYDVYIDRQKRKRQRLLRRLVLLSFVALVTIGSLTAYHIKQRILHADKIEQYEQLEDQLVFLEKEEENHQEEINLLNDEQYILEIARTNYFFSKEGELIFKVHDEEPSY